MYESYYYNPHTGLKTGLNQEETILALKEDRGVLWIDMVDVDDADIDLLTTAFNLHPLTVEDFIMPNTRPKIEKFADYLFLVMFALEPQCNHKSCKIRTSELDCCLGRNFLITFHNAPIPPLETCKDRIKKQSPMIMHGADMLLYYILDSCVDSYFPVITEYDNVIDEMSDELFKEPSQDTLRKIYRLKNEIVNLRRSVGPQVDVAGLIVRGDFQLIAPTNIIYFRNVYDNLMRLNDMIGASRDIINGAMEAYVSIMSNRLNEVMKTLTVIATIMMPLTLIASIYGMNFKHMPELEHKFGYPGILLVMGVLALSMLFFFRRKRWL